MARVVPIWPPQPRVSVYISPPLTKAVVTDGAGRQGLRRVAQGGSAMDPLGLASTYSVPWML